MILQILFTKIEKYQFIAAATLFQPKKIQVKSEFSPRTVLGLLGLRSDSARNTWGSVKTSGFLPSKNTSSPLGSLSQLYIGHSQYYFCLIIMELLETEMDCLAGVEEN